jgi:phage protein U
MSGSSYNPALDVAVRAIPFSGVGSFGLVVFQVSEHALALVRNVQRKTSVRIEEHQVVGAKPRLEFIAPELDQTSFKVFWTATFGVNPRLEISKLRELCSAGSAQYLILGGENFGRHVLLEVTEDWKRSGPDGAPIAAEVSLNFKEYL